MPTYVSGKNKFESAPEGLWLAVCCDVVDLGVVKDQWGEREKVEIRFQLDEKRKDGKRFLVMRRFTRSIGRKATLRAFLETWRGKQFTQAEIERFDLDVLLGVNAQVQIQHRALNDGGVWADIAAIVPAPRNVVKLQVEEYVKERDRVEQEDDFNHPVEDEGAEQDDVPF